PICTDIGITSDAVIGSHFRFYLNERLRTIRITTRPERQKPCCHAGESASRHSSLGISYKRFLEREVPMSRRVLLLGEKGSFPSGLPESIASDSGSEILAEVSSAVQEALTSLSKKGYDAVI